VVLTAAGVGLGASSGLATRLWKNADGNVIAQAGPLAAFLWVVGMGFRFAFALYASTSSGGRHVASFSLRHDITGARVWTTALVLMAFGEVLARVGYLQWRSYRLTMIGRRSTVDW
jgi:hypothetical protein